MKERLEPDIPGLVAVARRELREEFLRADLGITGANIAVAETGTLVVVTNEGNARLVSTLPRIHVAVVGIEKLVERFADVEPILRALPRSATGQLLTSYVSMLTGPAPGVDGEPKELHVILMDNKRSEMAKDPAFSQALRCIRCASCVNVCPVYRLVGTGLIVELRGRLVREQGQPLFQKAAFQVVNDRRGQTCCGAPARYAGAFDVAARNAMDNIAALEEAGARWIVSACPTCTVALKHELAATLRSEGHEDWAARAEALATKVRDFSSLVDELVAEGRLAVAPRPASAAEPPVTYHDSCHLKRKLGAHEPPRRLLRASGHDLREMAESDACCGMGGSYSLKFPEISRPILARKLENVRKTGARVVAMDCPGCMLQIGGGLDRAGDAVEARHVAELIADRLVPGPRARRP